MNFYTLVVPGFEVFAADEVVKTALILENPIKANNFSDLIIGISTGVIDILIPIMVLAIVWVGFLMVWYGATNPNKLDDLRWSLSYALLGLLIVLGAKGILHVIQSTVQGVLNDVSFAEPLITALILL